MSPEKRKWVENDTKNKENAQKMRLKQENRKKM